MIIICTIIIIALMHGLGPLLAAEQQQECTVQRTKCEMLQQRPFRDEDDKKKP